MTATFWRPRRRARAASSRPCRTASRSRRPRQPPPSASRSPFPRHASPCRMFRGTGARGGPRPGGTGGGADRPPLRSGAPARPDGGRAQPVGRSPRGGASAGAGAGFASEACSASTASRTRCTSSSRRSMAISAVSIGVPIAIRTTPGRKGRRCAGMHRIEPSMAMGTTGTPAWSARTKGPFLKGRMRPSRERVPSG